jgi:hypothetical protein
MARTATATLQTPWDCKWSRFGQVRAEGLKGRAEGLWVCVYPDESTRRPIGVSECETCPHWEYNPPATAHAATVGACPAMTRTDQRIEVGVRVAALVTAIVLAAMGFAVLTRPLAVPLTITLWIGAASCFMLGIWGRFNRRSLPVRSW